MCEPCPRDCYSKDLAQAIAAEGEAIAKAKELSSRLDEAKAYAEKAERLVGVQVQEIERLKGEADKVMSLEQKCQLYALEVERLKADIAKQREAFGVSSAERERVSDLQVRDFERAINAHCSCGGAGPGDGCVACEIYHDAKGEKRGSTETRKELVVDSCCGLCIGSHAGTVGPFDCGCKCHKIFLEKRPCTCPETKLKGGELAKCPACGGQES